LGRVLITSDEDGTKVLEDLAKEIRAQLAEISVAKLERDPTTGPAWVQRELEKLMPLMDRAAAIIETLERGKK